MQEKTSFDFSALALVGGLGIILWAFGAEGGDYGALNPIVHYTPYAIIIGGTFMATIASVRLATFMKFVPIIRVLIQEKHVGGAEVVELFDRLAQRARREGLLSLESEAETLEDPFLKKGIQLVVDGTEADNIETVLRIDMDQRHARHKEGFEMFEKMGGYSPTMGIVGTVMGLIIVLAQLDTGGDLGGGIAVAFLATLIGVGIANLVWLPIQGKLEAKNEAEQEHLEMMLQGVLAIQAGENPRTVVGKLEGFLSPVERERRAGAEGAGESEPAAAG